MKLTKLFFCILSLVFLTSAAMNAATITVVNTNDSGAGSLRSAISSANDGDTINFNLAGCPCTIILTSGELQINDSIIISGPGADQLTVSGNAARRIFTVRNRAFGVTISGLTVTNGLTSANGGGIFAESGTRVTISNSIISNNRATTVGAGTGSGGGIFADPGSVVTVLNSTISNNVAQISGGGIGTLSNVAAGAEIIISNSIVSNNTSQNGGGGIFISAPSSLTSYNTDFTDNATRSNIGGGGVANLGNSTIRGGNINLNDINVGGNGGGISNGGTLNVSGVAVLNNTANVNGEGGGVFNSGSLTIAMSNISGNQSQLGGGGITNAGNLTILNTTVSGNTTNERGGGIDNSSTANITTSTISGNSAVNNGGGINNTSILNLTNSTVSTNQIGSAIGGGISNGDNSTVNLINCTIAFNTSQFRAGGIYSGLNGITFNVRSSIIAKNTAPGGGPDALGEFDSLGFNLVGNNTNSTGFTNGTNGDIVGGGGPSAIDPLLGPLFNNGGFTLTHALLNGSPAIDKANSGAGIITDQRGNQRFFDVDTIANPPGGNFSDIGAYEFQSTTAAAVSITGKISNINGDGISKAKISLRMPSGEIKTAVSNGFGHFQFENIEVGETYIVTASSKRFSFNPQVFTVFDDITDLNLIALKQE